MSFLSFLRPIWNLVQFEKLSVLNINEFFQTFDFFSDLVLDPFNQVPRALVNSKGSVYRE